MTPQQIIVILSAAMDLNLSFAACDPAPCDLDSSAGGRNQ